MSNDAADLRCYKWIQAFDMRRGTPERELMRVKGHPDYQHEEYQHEIKREWRPNVTAKLVKSFSKQLNDFDHSYSLVKKLGSGNFGDVWLAWSKNDEHLPESRRSKFAVKIPRIDKQLAQAGVDYLSAIAHEVELQKRLLHVNIVSIFDVFHDFSAHKLFIVMEVCSGGELRSFIDSAYPQSGKGATGIAYTEVAEIMVQVCSAIAFMHSNGYMHRDLKPENVLYKDTSPASPVLLADFGLSTHFLTKEQQQQRKSHCCGTLSYMAPAVLDSAALYTEKCDVWSMGVMTFELLCGQRPFDGRSADETCAKIKRARPNYKLLAGAGSAALDFVKSCLEPLEDRRISAEGCLSHPFMRAASVSASNVAAGGGAYAGDNARDLPLPEIVQRLRAHTDAPFVARAARLVYSFEQEKLAITTGAAPKHVIKPRRPSLLRANTLTEAFSKLDVSHSGCIRRANFVTERNAAASGVSVKVLGQTFDKMDLDGSGSVNHLEFAAAMGPTTGERLDGKRLARAFEHFDGNGDGTIARDELRSALGLSQTEPDEVDRIFSAAGLGKDGKMDYERFVGMVAGEGASARGEGGAGAGSGAPKPKSAVRALRKHFAALTGAHRAFASERP